MNEDNNNIDTENESIIENTSPVEQNNNSKNDEASIFRTLTFFLFLA